MKPFGGHAFPVGEGTQLLGEDAWLSTDLDKWMAEGGGLASLIGDPRADAELDNEAGLMTIEEKLQDAISETERAFEQFNKARSRFRSEIKNEVRSIESASRQIAGEFERIVVALHKIETTYTSPDFVAAVGNAERLANALRAIQDLGSSRLTFAVIDKQP